MWYNAAQGGKLGMGTIGFRGAWRIVHVSVIGVALACAGVAHGETVVLSARDFSWRVAPRYVCRSGDVVRVSVPTSVVDSVSALLVGEIPSSRLHGAHLLRGKIRARASGVARPKLDYLGVKFQFCLADDLTGNVLYPNVQGRDRKSGTYGWRELTVGAPVAGLDLRKPVTLSLGLQGTTGVVEFDLSTLSVELLDDVYPQVNADFRVDYSGRIRDLPPLRGVMLPGGRDLTEGDFADLQKWGVKLARYQMIRHWGRNRANRDLDDYRRWMEGRLDHLEQVLAWAEKYGVRIVIDVHVAPGGRNEANEMYMFFERPYHDAFVDLWRRIATRFKGRPSVYGYDLINEPDQRASAPWDYWTIQREAAEAVRAVDPDTPVVIEANEMDSPAAFAYLSPFKMDNVIYQVHMYVPGEFTHQGVSGGNADAKYPDEARGWDKAYLRRILQRVRDFQVRHGARIYVGEFSAVAWAKGAERYLADCISIFEEYGWDWTYHSFRGWPGWSVEHEGESIDSMRPVDDSLRKRELLKGLRKGNGK